MEVVTREMQITKRITVVLAIQSKMVITGVIIQEDKKATDSVGTIITVIEIVIVIVMEIKIIVVISVEIIHVTPNEQIGAKTQEADLDEAEGVKGQMIAMKRIGNIVEEEAPDHRRIHHLHRVILIGDVDREDHGDREELEDQEDRN